MAREKMPDFLKLMNNYQQKLSNGQRAELRRAATPDALLDIPAFYYLLSGSGLKANQQAGRIIFFLPYVEHNEEAGTMGKQLQQSDGNEKRLEKRLKRLERRLFQVVRAESPDDLIYFRRLTQLVKPTVDWQKFGELLYYWGKNKKRELVRDYYS